MLTANQKKRIIRAIEEDYLMEGITLHVSKRYANQFACDVHPAIILNYINQGTPVNVPLGSKLDTSNEFEDIILFVAPGDVYSLSRDQPVEVLSVVGKVGGSEHIFDDSEYQLTGTGELEFLGPVYPDDRTKFTVTYTAQWTQMIKGGQYSDTLTVKIYAEDYEHTEQGQERFINGIIVADAIAGDLQLWFQHTFDFDDVTVLDVSQIRNLDEALEAGAVMGRYRQFDVVLSYMVKEGGRVVETVEDVEMEVNI